MKRHFLVIVLLFLAISSYSQSKSIVGSWIWRDSINTIQFFIKSDGTIEKRTALTSEDVWNKAPQIGTYKEHVLSIKWNDKSTQNVNVKFVDNNAEFQFIDQKTKPKNSYTFLRIVDEEIVPDK